MTPTRDVGWYRDPTHPDRHRFWDGRRWQSEAEHLESSDEGEPEPAAVPSPRR